MTIGRGGGRRMERRGGGEKGEMGRGRGRERKERTKESGGERINRG